MASVLSALTRPDSVSSNSDAMSSSSGGSGSISASTTTTAATAAGNSTEDTHNTDLAPTLSHTDAQHERQPSLATQEASSCLLRAGASRGNRESRQEAARRNIHLDSNAIDEEEPASDGANLGNVNRQTLFAGQR